MKPSDKLSRLRADLAVNKQDMESNMKRAADAAEFIAKTMKKINEDPAHAHFHYSIIGLTYVERERHLAKAEAAYKYCLTFREQIRTLQKE